MLVVIISPFQEQKPSTECMHINSTDFDCPFGGVLPTYPRSSSALFQAQVHVDTCVFYYLSLLTSPKENSLSL